MRLQFVNSDGLNLGLAMHVSSEGHDVGLVASPQDRIGVGIINRESQLDLSSDIIVFDSWNRADEAEELRHKGKRVLGASLWERVINSDADYSKQIIRMAGWPETDSERGTNLYITTWFNGSDFIATYVSLVYRRFMSSGRGPDVKFTGLISNFYQPTSRVFTTFLKPLKPILRKANHRGPFHIHALITEEGYAVKELNAHFSSPLSLPLFENTKESKTSVLLRLFSEDSRKVAALDQWVAALMVTLPPYPYPLETDPVELKGLEVPALRHFWLVDAMKTNGSYTTAGVNGLVGFVTARGSDSRREVNNKVRFTAGYEEATRRCYRTIDKLSIRDLQFRDDVGRNIRNLLRDLQKQSWIK